MLEVEKKWSWVKALSNTANGNISGKEKVMLETYIQMTYKGVHLHGHSHKTEEYIQEELIKHALAANGFATRAYNVGCMHWNYEPVTLDEILTVKTEVEKV